ncbi:SDR family oxidoreductase [Corticimicrobacter populi]|uniref:Short chain dehydrogenase n=1 Tax=Corticimicrobacter populi TaxID=2175229 RepID=A0A2V1JW27_9BURK|nr:SDR family oxidoreductase [Corticimicrobacter populi]PWF22535.1 short chain dehydrogenase [Corticimicrobacter populi]
MDKRLQDKVAIVTGAASGFGAAIARTYVAQGARVAIADINEEGARALAQELGAQALPVACDVTRRSDIENLVQQTVQTFGTLDIVVNNAGTTHRNQPLLDVDEATFDRVYAVNVKSIYYMTFAVLPILRGKGDGVILNIGSVAGIRPRPGLTWYNSSKGAVNMLSKSMAVELGPDGIRVNAICPVLGVTGLLEAFMGMPDTPDNRKKFLSTIPLGRFAEPADVANAALYLASDEARFITGVEFPVDGGRIV